MKRFMIFGGDIYYASGGMRDFEESFDEFTDAQAYLNKNSFEWWQVHDLETGKTSHSDRKAWS